MRLIITATLVLAAGVATAMAATTNAPGQVSVSLTDGSRILGVTSVKELAVESAAVGNVTIPLERVASLKRQPDTGTATIRFVNGDSLQGRLVLAVLPLRTLVGEVGIPVAAVTGLEVGTAEEPVKPVVNPQAVGRQVINDARQLDAAIDQWALEKGRRDGVAVDLPAAATYLRSPALVGPLQEGQSPKDALGNPFVIGVVGPNQVKIHPKTKKALDGVGIDWGAF